MGTVAENIMELAINLVVALAVVSTMLKAAI